MHARAYRQDQKQELIGKISGLMKELQQLAPHPDKPGYTGPLFINANPNARIASEHDGMLGSMMMETLIGGFMTEALSDACGDWVHSIDINNAMELYSEYITDIERSKQQDEQDIQAHGQGTLARLSGKSISNSFNMRGSMSEGMQAFLDDMPKRMQVEKHLAYYLRQLEMLDAPMPAPAYAHPAPAPAPRPAGMAA